MDPWNCSLEDVCSSLGSSLSDGLSEAEARARLEKSGYNELPKKTGNPAWKIFLKQFNSLIVVILLVAAVVSGFLGEWENTVVISVIIILNALLGFAQEYHAEKSMAALLKLSAPTSKVIRDGRLLILFSREIVPGDLVLLEQGDFVPADGRVIKSYLLQTQEAALTGESEPVKKETAAVHGRQIAVGDKKNMVFTGTSVVYGKGYILVTATGIKTELGRIASLLKAANQERTPLEKKLNQLGAQLVFLTLVIVGLVFIIGVARGYSFINMFLVSISLAVAAIPEGLPAVVTIALAFGVKKMAARNALVRRLSSVETLGCATVICTDKTGTLTRNEMMVRELWVNLNHLRVTGSGYEPRGEFFDREQKIAPQDHEALMLALKAGVLCNGAKLFNEGGEWKVVGDPTEGALLALAEKAGCKKDELEKQNPVMEELPFDSERKRMSVLRKTSEGLVLYVKGAPDVILELSNKMWAHGGETELSDAQRKMISGISRRFATQALRVLAIAYKKMPENAVLHPSSEQALTFVGLVAMMDSPRTEARAAIETCRAAGIRPVMITGDHKETAFAIATELGLMEKNSSALTGFEVDSLSPEALREAVGHAQVFARVSPEHKLKIVRAFRSNGQIVAMTGDGVNDAPALKEADIGVAMGRGGTDVAKEVSDMIITDDNFASIVHAVEEGRGIYDNIMKFVYYLVSHNLAEIFVLFLAMLFGFRDLNGSPFIPLTALQILWMNLATDGLPALALSLDKADPRIMRYPPRDPARPVLDSIALIKIFICGTLLAAGALVFCRTGLDKGPVYAQSMTLTSLIFFQFIPIQMIRHTYHLPFFSNIWLNAALATSCLLQLMVLYVPFFQKVFGTVPLDLHEWPILFLTCLGVWAAGTAAFRLVDYICLKRNSGLLSS